MKKSDALRFHHHFEASAGIAIVMPIGVTLLALCGGLTIADSLAVGALALAFCAMMATLYTDLLCHRIPNGLSFVALAAGPAWWAASLIGSDLPDLAGTGVIWQALAPLYGIDASGSLLPEFGSVTYPLRILLDLAIMGVAFVPLYLSFSLGLGFGGGDVKIMTALMPFFGWPLGFDFFLLTFITGGFLSVMVMSGRILSKCLLRFGVKNDKLEKCAGQKEFPFAPAIAVAAIICFAIKMQGLS